jgi:hypothetical protein
MSGAMLAGSTEITCGSRKDLLRQRRLVGHGTAYTSTRVWPVDAVPPPVATAV